MCVLGLGREGYNWLNKYFDLRSLEIGEGLHPEAFSVRLFFFFFLSGFFNFDLYTDSNIDRLTTPVDGKDRFRIQKRVLIGQTTGPNLTGCNVMVTNLRSC